jgi:putative ABC transport system permease protein
VFEWPRGVGFIQALEDRVGRLPGVAAATTALNPPLAAGWTTRVTVAGRPAPPAGEQDEAWFRPVGPGYFGLLGIPRLAGREFEPADDGSTPRVAVIDQAFARRYFPDGSPIGESVVIFEVPREIVGVVGEVRHRGLEAEVQPTMYVPLHQNPMSTLSLVVRTPGDPMTLLPAVRGEVAGLDPDLPVFGATSLEETISGSVAERRFTLLLLSLFAGLALVLAAVGIYGTVALGVAERRHEIGVRLALGGGRGDVVRLILAEGLGLTLAGVGLGVAGALAVRRTLASLVFGIGTADPATYVAVAAALAAVALAASWIPARRATAVDPVVVLQHE